MISAKSPCPCGSGKQYKHCHREQDRALEHLGKKHVLGQLPFGVGIISKSGESTSMNVSMASITRDGQTTIILDEKITLSVNSTKGDKTPNSSALLSIPADGFSPGKIITIGNASVSNNSSFSEIALINNRKCLFVKNERFFVKVKITKTKFFDFFFGLPGQSEPKDPISGEKLRPHLQICPDGNGGYIRLRGLKKDNEEADYEIKDARKYFSKERLIFPQQLFIKSPNCEEILEATFSVEENKVILNELRFINQSWDAAGRGL